MDLIFASNNAHKLEEIRAVVSDNIDIVSLNEIGFTTELPETSGTIPGNALQKAETLYKATRRNCFADDSGLEVFALDNRPGVDTAHYAGAERNAEANNNKLLKELEGVTDRSARFITVISLIIDGKAHEFTGEIKGRIALQKEGTGGFGYDPLFIPEGFDNSFAALPQEIKNEISHRARAVHAMNKWLRNNC